MKNSEKIWNLLQSPNTFEMGMELLETMVGIDPEIPYELFTAHNALEWFQEHKNIRFPQLILDGFLSIWESGDAAYADCLTDTHSLSLGGVRQISQAHLDLFQNMPNLTLSVDWKSWLKLSKKLPSTLVVDTFRLDCTECVVSMVDLLTQVECSHLEIEYPPKSIRVIGDCLSALPKFQTLRCGVGEGVLIWLYRNKDLVHPVQTIQTGREMLTFADTDGTLQERVSSIKVSACVADEPEYNATIYPNLGGFIVGDVLGDMVSFVRAHKDIPSMNVRQVYMQGINHYLYDVANRYGIEFGRSTSRPLEALPVLLYGVLPVMESVREKIDVPLEVHRRLMKRELTLNVYNIEKVIEFGKLSHRRLWDTVSLRVFFRQVLVLLRLGATLSVSSLKTLHNALVNLTLRDHLDLLDLLLGFEEFGVYDVEGTHEQTLISRLLETHFSEGLTFEKAMSRFPNKRHIDSYKLWWKEWQSLSVQPSSIKHLEAMEKLGLSHELLDDAVLQLINQSERSKHTVEWLLVRIQDMLERGDVTLQRAEQLMDRALSGFEDTISFTAIRLDTNTGSQRTVDTIFSLLLKHQIPCAPTEFKHVMDRENEGASRTYGDWAVQQFTNLNEMTQYHLRHMIGRLIGRLMKVLMVSNQSVEEQVKALQQHFDPSHNTGWLYQPWAYRRSLQKFDAILGENGDEWVLNGVTELFDRRKYLIRSVEQRISRLVSKGLWTEAQRDAFLCKQVATSKNVRRYVSQNFKMHLFFALCRTGFHGLSAERAIAYFVPFDEVELTPKYRSVIKSVLLAWRGLFAGYWDGRYSYSREKLSIEQVHQYVQHLRQSALITTQEYEDFVLANFQDQFNFSDSIPLKVAKTLFDILKSRQVDISKDLLAVYQLAQRWDLDVSQFDAHLMQTTDLFSRDTPVIMVSRILWMVSSGGSLSNGVLSPERYDALLLANFSSSFSLKSPEKDAGQKLVFKRLYTALFGVLKRTQPAIDEHQLNTLFEIAEAYQLNPVQFHPAVFQSKGLLTKVKIAERARQLYQQNAWSKKDYQQALLESLNSIGCDWWETSRLSSELSKDLLDAIAVFQPKLSTQRIQDLFELIEEHQWSEALLDDSLRSVKDFFATWSAGYVCERVLTLVQQGQWSQEEYNTWLLTNFEQSSYIYSYKKLPKNIYQDLFGALGDTNVEIPARKFNSLLALVPKYSLDASLLDDSLRSVKDFFATWSAGYVCERVLTLVQQGQWSQEEYNTWLLTNYNHRFTYIYGARYDVSTVKMVYVGLFGCLCKVNEHDAAKLSVLASIQQCYEFDFGVIKHVLRNTSNAFQTSDRSLINLVEKWREDQIINSEDFDTLLQKSLPTLAYHSIIPDTWYQRALDLLDQDDSRLVDPKLLGQLSQVLLKLGGYSTTIDRSILAISKNEGVPRLTLEVVPRYLLHRLLQGVSLDVPEYLWFVRRKPTDDEVLQMVQYHQQGWTLFPTPHILQHMVHQIPSTPDGEVYLQDCVAYWCQETGKAWFEGWTMDKLLVGLRAVPNDIPQLDILGTQMDVLPSECVRFTQLQKLFVYNTGLSTIPQIMSLSRVEILSISNTSLELSQVLNLPSLKTLYCKNVQVSEEHQGQFEANGVELRF